MNSPYGAAEQKRVPGVLGSNARPDDQRRSKLPPLAHSRRHSGSALQPLPSPVVTSASPLPPSRRHSNVSARGRHTPPRPRPRLSVHIDSPASRVPRSSGTRPPAVAHNVSHDPSGGCSGDASNMDSVSTGMMGPNVGDGLRRVSGPLGDSKDEMDDQVGPLQSAMKSRHVRQASTRARTCVVCQTRPAKHYNLPCMHRCLCRQCHQEALAEAGAVYCPTCMNLVRLRAAYAPRGVCSC